MSLRELEQEIGAGVVFWGYEDGGVLLGVMGVQPVRDVELIRHAYVAPHAQRRGIGGALLPHLTQDATRPLLLRTRAAAPWAIALYPPPRLALADPDRP